MKKIKRLGNSKKCNCLFNYLRDINRPNSKLQTYVKIKENLGTESYLNTIKNVKRRIHLSKLCLSNHELMIEKGRHSGIVAYNKFCSLSKRGCWREEFHFLLNVEHIHTFCKNYLTALNDCFPTWGICKGNIEWSLLK